MRRQLKKLDKQITQLGEERDRTAHMIEVHSSKYVPRPARSPAKRKRRTRAS